MSSTPRQRDWMFSSAVSGGTPGELVLQGGQRRLEHAFDGNLAVLDAAASAPAAPRRPCSSARCSARAWPPSAPDPRPAHRPQYTASAPNRRRRTVPSPRPESGACPHSRACPAPARRTRSPPGPAAARSSPGTRRDRRRTRRPRDRPTYMPSVNAGARCVTSPCGIHHEGIAVEHQFVLAADQIDEHQRNARFARPAARTTSCSRCVCLSTS